MLSFILIIVISIGLIRSRITVNAVADKVTDGVIFIFADDDFGESDFSINFRPTRAYNPSADGWRLYPHQSRFSIPTQEISYNLILSRLPQLSRRDFMHLFSMNPPPTL